MTDNEINVTLYNMGCAAAYKDTITISKETAIGLCDYFNRQKAEIKSLEEMLDSAVTSEANTVYTTNYMIAEAVKEFAERIEQSDVSESDKYIIVRKDKFDKILKETEGAAK